MVLFCSATTGRVKQRNSKAVKGEVEAKPSVVMDVHGRAKQRQSQEQQRAVMARN